MRFFVLCTGENDEYCNNKTRKTDRRERINYSRKPIDYFFSQGIEQATRKRGWINFVLLHFNG